MVIIGNCLGALAAALLLLGCGSTSSSLRENGCPQDLPCPRSARCSCQVVGSQVIEEVDYGQDGIIDWRTVHHYGTEGRRVRDERHFLVQGASDEVWSYTYDDRGDLVEVSLDSGADGTIDRLIRYAYDARGYRSTASIDEGADGSIDQRGVYRHDDRGNLVLEELDRDGDGLADSRTTYSYDRRGHRVGMEYDDGADGSVDRRCLYDPPCAPPFVTCSSDACEWIGRSQPEQRKEVLPMKLDQPVDLCHQRVPIRPTSI